MMVAVGGGMMLVQCRENDSANLPKFGRMYRLAAG